MKIDPTLVAQIVKDYEQGTPGMPTEDLQAACDFLDDAIRFFNAHGETILVRGLVSIQSGMQSILHARAWS